MASEPPPFSISRPADLPWRIVLTVVPLVLGIAAMSLFVPDTWLHETLPKTSTAVAEVPASEAAEASAPKAAEAAAPETAEAAVPGYPTALIGYAAAVSLHLLVCCAMIVFFLDTLRSATASESRRLIGFASAYLAVVLVAIGIARFFDPIVYRATFQNIEALFPAGAPYLDPVLGSLTRVDIAALLPTAFGVVATVFAAAAAEALVGRLPAPPIAPTKALNKTRIKACEAGLKRCFQALSLVLVTSTLTASLFFHLPAGLYTGAAQKAIQDYGNMLSIFWGTIFTLTLLAAFAPYFLALRRTVRDHHRQAAGDRSADEDPDWLTDSELFGGFSKQLGMLLTLLAPLLTGSLGNFIQAIPK